MKLKQVWNRTNAYVTFKSKHINHVLGNAAAFLCCAQSEAKGTVAHITPWMVSAVTFTAFCLSLMLQQLKAKLGRHYWPYCKPFQQSHSAAAQQHIAVAPHSHTLQSRHTWITMTPEVLYLLCHPAKSNYNRSQLFAKVSCFTHWYKSVLDIENMFLY